MKVVVNKCYGGFGLSTKAILRARELGAKWAFPPYVVMVGESYEGGKKNTKDDWGSWHPSPSSGFSRSDPILVQVVEELGSGRDSNGASGSYAKLEITEVPDDVLWEIGEYDGTEWVEEVHQRW